MSALWVTDNGAIVCEQESMYLRSAVRATPEAASHHTPLGMFVRVSAADAAHLAGLGVPVRCETCGVSVDGTYM